jgi:hypothetical protein
MRSRVPPLPSVLAGAVLTGAIVAVAAVAPPPARADVFGPTSLLSASSSEQVVYAHDPAVSEDGRYVAFDGDYDGLTGVWRREVTGSTIEPVAVGPPQSPQGSAELPSISADGRYISFTTTAPLDPFDDTNGGPDVYVRDMADPHSEPCQAPSEEEARLEERPPCAYTLASAVNGSRTGLSYIYPDNRVAEEPAHGSIASGRSALSANGQEVAFVTTAISNLDDPDTPALQVAVRDIPAHTTQLVSVRDDPATGAPATNPATGQPEPVAALEGVETYGAVYTGEGARAPSFREPQPREVPAPIGASISADGSTVTWMGTNVGLQATTLAGESLPPKYAEPLWRRIGDGPQAPVRRVTGGSDPADPACAASGEAVLPTPPDPSDPCQGPFATLLDPGSPGIVSGVEGDDLIPRLSADGNTVAFLANAPLVSLGEGFDLGGDAHSDLYIVDMNPGLTRSEALRPLTELASGDETDLATNAQIIDLAISPDGSQVAFATKRTQFPLGSPAFVSPPGADSGMAELFDADLADDTLTRVTQGFEGGPSEHPHEPVGGNEDPYTSPDDGALSPSFTADGNTLVFSSTASNLVYGDGNTPPADESLGAFDGSDVFAVSRTVFSASPAAQFVSSPPPNPALTPLWILGVTPSSRADGSVLLDADVPGAGSLRAGARASVLVEEAVGARRAVHGSRGRDGARQARVRTRLASASVASAAVAAAGPGLLVLRIRLAPRYASLAGRAGGLSATLTVTFAASGQPTLRQRLEVTFVRRPASNGRTAARRRRKSRRA